MTLLALRQSLSLTPIERARRARLSGRGQPPPEKGLTQGEMANRIKVSRVYYNRLERGLVQPGPHLAQFLDQLTTLSQGANHAQNDR